jgi:hypothetical protein
LVWTRDCHDSGKKADIPCRAFHEKDRGMKSFHRTSLCVLAAVLAGCSVPLKHSYLTAPQIDGIVTRAGKPVAGMHVQLAEILDEGGELDSSSLKQEAVTDAQGHFSVGPIRREAGRTNNPLFKVDQRTVPWGLRLSKDDASWQAGWVSDPDMFGDVPKSVVRASCDLGDDSKSSVIDGDIAIVGKGPCNLKVTVVGKK